ncbi:MAG: HD domain-containing protein [Clostridia bacterium]|nr:HD domain-containing protein [Clostridia bacterium]
MVTVLDKTIFSLYAKDILENPKVNKLSEYLHHKNVTRLEHSLNVAATSVKVARKYNLKVDERSIVRGALLHDFFLYDLVNERIENHLVRHPYIAYENAKAEFMLNDIEKDIILKHMWPITNRLPKYKESLIVCLVDTYCAFKEKLNNL